jgi:hypothetical protein
MEKKIEGYEVITGYDLPAQTNKFSTYRFGYDNDPVKELLASPYINSHGSGTKIFDFYKIIPLSFEDFFSTKGSFTDYSYEELINRQTICFATSEDVTYMSEIKKEFILRPIQDQLNVDHWVNVALAFKIIKDPDISTISSIKEAFPHLNLKALSIGLNSLFTPHLFTLLRDEFEFDKNCMEKVASLNLEIAMNSIQIGHFKPIFSFTPSILESSKFKQGEKKNYRYMNEALKVGDFVLEKHLSFLDYILKNHPHNLSLLKGTEDFYMIRKNMATYSKVPSIMISELDLLFRSADENLANFKDFFTGKELRFQALLKNLQGLLEVEYVKKKVDPPTPIKIPTRREKLRNLSPKMFGKK